MLIALIATAWLGVSALCWAVCMMAARGDAAMASTAVGGGGEPARPAVRQARSQYAAVGPRRPAMRPDTPRLTVG